MLLLFFMAVACAYPQQSAEEGQPQDSDYGLMKQYYDKGFKYNRMKEYDKAIGSWNQVLQIDSNQITAKKMIGEARRKLDEINKPRATINPLIAGGKYLKAYRKLNEILSQDPTNTAYKDFQEQLGKISEIVPSLPSNSKSWRIAAIGIKAYLCEPEDPHLAHDALRYARELNPKNKKLKELLELFISLHQKLVNDESLPPGIGIMQYKQNVALHNIYEGKYHLAVKELSSILALEPNDVTALKRLGSAYFQLKNLTQARKVWLKAYRLSPNDTQLAKYLRELKK
ncbi:MAG: tetratricopeptide repeat protein [bacterium]